MAFYKKKEINHILVTIPRENLPDAVEWIDNRLLWAESYRIWTDKLALAHKSCEGETSEWSDEDSDNAVEPLEVESDLEDATIDTQEESKNLKAISWDIFEDKDLKAPPHIRALKDRSKEDIAAEENFSRQVVDFTLYGKAITKKVPRPFHICSPNELIRIFRRKRVSSGKSFRTYTKLERSFVDVEERTTRQLWVQEWLENGREPVESVSLEKKKMAEDETKRSSRKRPGEPNH